MALIQSHEAGDQLVGPGRLVCIVEYDGSHYHGWQTQKTGIPSVQAELEKALGQVADHPVKTVCAGRTDSGVHGAHQVVHFDARVSRSLRSWVMGVNTNLPSDIAIHWIGTVKGDFSARFSATARRYHYVIYNNPVKPALFNKTVSWHYRPLDAEKMHNAAQCLIGEHDFSSFRAIGCQSKTPFRNVHFIRVTRNGHLIVIDIQANAFLHHMVRNIAGVLMAVGSGKFPGEWVQEVLANRDRTKGGVTAPPFGLYLVGVDYPERYGIPSPHVLPAYLGALSQHVSTKLRR